MKHLFEHGPKWHPHDVDGDEWMGFEAVRPLPGTDAEILIVPLPGHTRGHSAIAVKDADGWLLHCGDGYFHRHQVETPAGCPPGLRAFQAIVGLERKRRLENEERLRELNERKGGAGGEIRMFCAHDLEELERLRSGQALEQATKEISMPDYTKKNVSELKDSAPEFGFDEIDEARFPAKELDAEQAGFAHHRLKPGKRQAFGHQHDDAEEVCFVIAGSGTGQARRRDRRARAGRLPPRRAARQAPVRGWPRWTRVPGVRRAAREGRRPRPDRSGRQTKTADQAGAGRH